MFQTARKHFYCRHVTTRACLRKGKTFPKQALVFMRLQYKYLENTVGKGEIASNKQFLLIPQCFLPVFETFLPFSLILKLSSANYFSLEESKICHL